MNLRLHHLLLALSLFTLPLVVGACSSKKSEPTASEEGEKAGEEEDTTKRHPTLMDPSRATGQTPDSYRVEFDTTKGKFRIEVRKDWAPLAAERFYHLVLARFYDDVAFFRVIDGFMVQFGINGDPEVNQIWREATFPDDPVKQSNSRGRISFATSGPDSRTTQVFINYVDNNRLDGMGFAPFGAVISGMDVVDALYKGYGEGMPAGRGPNQGRIQNEGNEYLRADFPELDWVKTARIVTFKEALEKAQQNAQEAGEADPAE